MKAVVIDRFGGADAVRIADVPRPVPAEGEVLVAMRAASINPADWKLREGWLRAAHEPVFPYVLGFDGAGVVVESGQRVAVKSAVGRGGHGTMAEFATVPAHLAAPLPDTIDFFDAAAVPTAGITAWEMVFEAGRVAPGHRVLVNGGAGGTGSLAVQLARMAGAEVAATAGPENLDYLRSLGAAAIDYRAGNVEAAVRRLFPNGLDTILDTVGQGALAEPLAMLRGGGRLITVATLVEGEIRPDPSEAERRGIAVVTATSDRSREGEQLRNLIEALAAGHIAWPAVDVVPATDASAAIERVRQGHVRGKIVLDLRAWE